MKPYIGRSIYQDVGIPFAEKRSDGWAFYTNDRDVALVVREIHVVGENTCTLYESRYHVKDGSGYIPSSEADILTSINEIIRPLRETEAFSSAMNEYRSYISATLSNGV